MGGEHQIIPPLLPLRGKEGVSDTCDVGMFRLLRLLTGEESGVKSGIHLTLRQYPVPGLITFFQLQR